MKNSLRLSILFLFVLAAAFNPAKSVTANTCITDPLLLLLRQYPAVYNQLVQEFASPETVQFSVKENIVYVSFKNKKHLVSAVYTVAGNKKYSIENIGLDVPATISERLKKEYAGWSIYYCKNIVVDNKSIHEVIIEDNREYRVINFNEGEMQEIQRLKK